MTHFARIPTPLGTLLVIAEHGALTGIHFEGGKHVPAIRPDWQDAPDLPVIARCAQQLAAYLAGQDVRFDLPARPKGTAFQQRIWEEIARIPYGDTLTYAELARRAGAPAASRAAGAATGRNPLSILVPCHRVVGSSGALTGYAGGLDRKARLLAMERTPRAAPSTGHATGAAGAPETH